MPQAQSYNLPRWSPSSISDGFPEGFSNCSSTHREADSCLLYRLLTDDRASGLGTVQETEPLVGMWVKKTSS